MPAAILGPFGARTRQGLQAARSANQRIPANAGARARLGADAAVGGSVTVAARWRGCQYR